MEFIYIGESFYFASGTLMSSLYDAEGDRQDWGSVQMALENGHNIHIRQATEVEKDYYRLQLKKLQGKF